MSVTAPRDFCNLTHWEARPDGNIILIAKSVEHPKCPEAKPYVRATLHIGGWVLEPAPNNSTKVTYLMQTDINGSVPTFVVKKVTSQQGRIVVTVAEVSGHIVAHI